MINIQSIIAFASLLTALGVIFAFLAKTHKWFLKQEKQDKDIKNIKEELSIICSGILACLDGLEQQGCNHTVPKTKKKLEEHINKKAHE